MAEILKCTIDDIKLGGTIVFSNGKKRIIAPHSCRVYLNIRGMAVYEVFYYPDGYQHDDGLDHDEVDPSDVIQLILTPFNETESKGWLMNVQDVLSIIQGLSIAANMAIDDGVPPSPPVETEYHEVICQCGGVMDYRAGMELWQCRDCPLAQSVLRPEQENSTEDDIDDTPWRAHAGNL